LADEVIERFLGIGQLFDLQIALAESEPSDLKIWAVWLFLNEYLILLCRNVVLVAAKEHVGILKNVLKLTGFGTRYWLSRSILRKGAIVGKKDKQPRDPVSEGVLGTQLEKGRSHLENDIG
jgi:hypothetical protein